jgi:hypothetical protein
LCEADREARKAAELQDRLCGFDLSADPPTIPDKTVLLSLAQDLPAVWNAPTTDMRLKQRITRILINEIIADVDELKHEVVLLIHWAGGRHSELRIRKNKLGRHQRCTSVDAIEVVRQMSGKFPEEQIAATLNRLGLRTGAGNTWSTQRVHGLRRYHELPNNSQTDMDVMTLEEAAHRLGISSTSVRRMIDEKLIPAKQVVPCAPWEIPAKALENSAVLHAAKDIRNRTRGPQIRNGQQEGPLFSDM